MTTNSAKNLFIYGSLLCFAALVALTIDTMGKLDSRAPQITEQINAGKKVWHKYDCIGCHTILGNGSYFAPDLTKTTVRKPKGYLKKFLLNPRAIKATAVMPRLGLSEKEADDLIALLEWTSKIDTNDWPPKPILAVAIKSETAAKGQMLFQQHDCVECHQINGIGGAAGPDLSHVGSKITDPEWYIKHFKEPASVVPDSAMPSYEHLNDEELRAMVDYLLTLK